MKQQVYVVPFIGAAVFFLHDLTFVSMYDTWFHVYNHWWVKMWWFALVGTVAFEVLMLCQVYRYGHQELWPNLTRRAFGGMIVLGTLGIGALWALVKRSIGDDLFFITFATTAVWSVPFHTAIMSRRQSRAGQSIAMELSTVVMITFETAAFAQMAPFFRSPVYLIFAADTGGLTKIVVTACKRSENLLQTPVAVQVLSGDALNSSQTNDLVGLSTQVPQVLITKFPSGAGAVIAIRGIGSPSTDPGIESTVSTVFDGVQLSRGLITSLGFFDVQSVQVLKGPQALFCGKNSGKPNLPCNTTPSSILSRYSRGFYRPVMCCAAVRPTTTPHPRRR